MNVKGENNCFSKVHQFKIPKRTEGDGMEKEDISSLGISKYEQEQSFGDQKMCELVNINESSLPSVPVTETVVKLIPKTQMIDKKNTSFNTKFTKKPKFIPYEPYKAATNPMTKEKTNKFKPLKFIKNSNSVEDVVQLKKLYITENIQCQQSCSEGYKQTEWEVEKRAIVQELDRLKEENTELENQLKFQAQVNAEVKKLLVAAVGEDIETRVQLLTEDKLQLAKQLLKTAKTLSTHQEQIEWLAGQCEVWRSKFLSSSILVEDLAKWKARLCQKVSGFQNALKGLLEDKDKIREDTFKTFINLSTLQEKFNLNVICEENYDCHVISSNSLDLCASNRHLSEQLIIQLLHENVLKKKYELDALECLTPAEKNAEQALSQPMISLKPTDLACDAVMTGAALALSSASPHCSHCNGMIKTI